MSWYMRLLKKLASLRLTVGLLLWLAFLCVLGTLVPQHALQSMDGAPLAMRMASHLSLVDVFHSIWFLVPAVILSLNASACMYLWRNSFGTSSSMPRAGLKEVCLPPDGDPDKIIAEIEGFMKDTHRVSRVRDEGRRVILCEKGLPRRYAPFMVHLSIVMILLGAGMAFFGYKGSLTLPVGRMADVVALGSGSVMHLPFAVRCDDFRMELYENGMPKEYRSEISFLRGDTVVHRSSVRVNHPASFSGILFSQSGYSQEPAADIQVGTPEGSTRITLAEGSSVQMKDTGYTVHALKVLEDIMHMGPAAQLVIEKPGGDEEVWIFKDIERIKAAHPGILEKMPHFNPSRVAPYLFSLDGVKGMYTTTLGINYDPGVPLVGLGAVLFMAGICIAFMVVHEKVWISVEHVKDGLKIQVAQRTNTKQSEISPGIMEHMEGLAGVKS